MPSYYQVNFYQIQLVALSVICGIALLVDRFVSKSKARHKAHASADERLENGKGGHSDGALAALTRKYLLVYAIVMGKWGRMWKGRVAHGRDVQARTGCRAPTCTRSTESSTNSPSALSLFSSSPALSLQASQRPSSASGPINSESPTPHHPQINTFLIPLSGRRKLCLAFCVAYALACVCITIPSLPTLLFGRVLGGIATSILFSAFESWVISSANAAALPASDLSTIMGRATLVNGFVATAAGVASNQLVAATGGNYVSPFVASGLLLAVAWVVIRGTWSENYGGGGGGAQVDKDPLQVKRLGQAWAIVRNSESRLVTLPLKLTRRRPATPRPRAHSDML